MPLDNKTIRKYRSIGHHLSPVVMISSGLSENIIAEINRALKDHELIKVKVNAAEREVKKEIIKNICQTCNAELIQQIGHIALIYKKARDPNPKLSNILRS